VLELIRATPKRRYRIHAHGVNSISFAETGQGSNQEIALDAQVLAVRFILAGKQFDLIPGRV